MKTWNDRKPFLVAASILVSLALIPTLAPGGTADYAGAPEGARPAAIFPDGHLFHLEIARTPEERGRGYMFRDRVGPEEGMLFLFPTEDFYAFWMKNCRVPLDIIWLSGEMRVVHLEGKVPPCRRDPCPSYPPMSKARFVLEVQAGMAEKSGLRIGDAIRVNGVDLNAPISP